MDLLPKMKIEVVASDGQTDEILQTLLKSACTGNIGDGKVFLYEITEVIRIRNRQCGEAAL